MNGRERILAMFDGQPVDHLPLMPITMMYAADQIGVPYGRYCSDYHVLVEAQLATAARFGLDYVSCISDPAREAADCGAEIARFDDQPPAIVEERALLADKTALARLEIPDPRTGERMSDRLEAVALLRRKAGNQLLVEGWVEGPAAEGSDLRGINNLMMDFIDDPVFVNDLFEFIIEMELRFAIAQLEAGADLIGIGDAAASLVGPRIYQECVLPWERRLVDGIQQAGGRVRLHICGNTRDLLDGMGSLGCDLVDLDAPASVARARAAMGPDQTLLGNMDPVRVLRNGTPETVTAALEQCHREAGERFIVGAGCEIARETPPENVEALRDYARQHGGKTD